MKLLHRRNILSLVAALILAFGTLYPWYCLPSKALETFQIRLTVAQLGRVLALTLALLTCVSLFHRISNRILRLFFWISLLAVLLFPYIVVTWSPAVNYLSTSYYKQSSRVNRHIEKNFPNVQAQWKQNILLDRSTPVASVADFSIGDVRFFQMASWDRLLVRGLGYGNNFFAFVGRGWGYTVSGLVLCLLAIYLSFGDRGLDIFTKDATNFAPWFGVGLMILSISLVAPNIINFQLDSLIAQGKYYQVINLSNAIGLWYPPLKSDSRFLCRMARAAFYGNASNLALVSFAKGVEEYNLNNYFEAERYFQQYLNDDSTSFVTKGYLATTYINKGVSYFNARKPEIAANYFKKALQIFPNHVEGLYDLLLAEVASAKFEDSAKSAQKLIETQRYSQLPSLSIIAQGYLQKSWTEFRSNDPVRAWNLYRQSIDKESWDERDDRTFEPESEEPVLSDRSVD